MHSCKLQCIKCDHTENCKIKEGLWKSFIGAWLHSIPKTYESHYERWSTTKVNSAQSGRRDAGGSPLSAPTNLARGINLCLVSPQSLPYAMLTYIVPMKSWRINDNVNDIDLKHFNTSSIPGYSFFAPIFNLWFRTRREKCTGGRETIIL